MVRTSERTSTRLSAAAPNLEQLLIHATMIGPDPGKPLLSLEDYEGEGVDRVFVCPSDAS